MRGLRLVGVILVLLALGIGAVIGVRAMIGGGSEPLGRLDLPGPGQVRPDYLADGTPVWVARHDDGEVSVLSGFDTHRPSGVGKVLWWCVAADALDNPEHGSKYDEYGFKVGGPAPTGLPSYATRIEGGRVVVTELREAPPPDARHSGPSEGDREWCVDAESERLFHTFAGWQAWDSPTEAVEAAPEGWILLNAQLALRDGAVVLCGARDGCADSVVAANIDPTDAEREFGPLFGERFIAQVRDGQLVGVTRVLPFEVAP